MSSTVLLDPVSLDKAQLAAWQALADSAIEPNPFYEPAFVLAAIEAGEPSTRGLRLLVVVGDDGRWLACLPAVKARHARLLPVWQAWNGPYVFLTCPLLAGESPGRQVAALLGGVPGRVTGRAIEFGCLPDEGLAELAFNSGLQQLDWAPAWRRRFERAFLVRRPDADAYTASISSHHRREANRRRRRLADTVGAEPEIVAAGGSAEAVDAFLEVEASGWKGLAGTALASREEDAAFFRLMCERFDRLGRVEILLLRAGGRVLAAECVLLAGEGCFTFKIAFDEEFARFSPGIEVVLGQIGWFHDSGILWSDSCADPDNRMINRLWPDRRRLQSLVLVEPGRRGSPARGLLRLAQGLKQKMRKRDAQVPET